MYDLVVVGAGLFGSTFAYLAKQLNQKVLVIDQRNHIGGNCYTEKQDGIVVHNYGPHIFHTSNENVWQFINQFAKFNNYIHRVKAFNYNAYSMPINLMTLQQIWGISNKEDAIKKINDVKINYNNPRNLEEYVLSQVGKELYETLIYGYTKKQWGVEPENLPTSIITRLPIRFTWDDNYFNDSFQGIPIGGYTQIFEKMLKGCVVRLNIDFFNDQKELEKLGKKILFTGKIDQYFNYKFGMLEYRTSTFDTKYLEQEDYQGVAQMNYTSPIVPYTRIIEHKYFDLKNSSKNNTIVSWEYSKQTAENDVPCYPLLIEKNKKIFDCYKQLSEQQDKVIFGGRLSLYKYIDMDQTILLAMKMFQNYIKEYNVT